MFAMTLWCIWEQQNEKLWDDMEVHSHQQRHNAGSGTDSNYNDAEKWGSSAESQDSSSVHRWLKPGRGGVKCNVNAAIFQEQRCYRVGICLRGENREYIAAKILWFQRLPKPQEVEVCGLKEAKFWLGNINLVAVSIELRLQESS
ncbi:hypothetical protein TSUD_275990 [Trifolium subterraneum]|uniref:Uncharacterized protein n=1 Tax=Trifolium subterraneum TaxID=3900 RepID=A0A2Z6MZK7_TRISU|nr:hypothetical protein TSUD_275990 [Trifolium subterraneum]